MRELSPAIAAVGRALPPNYADQETLIAAFRALWGGRAGSHHLESLHRAVGVGGRYLALPMQDYYGLTTFAAANAVWGRIALDLAEAAAGDALARAQLSPRDVDHVFFVTVT